MRKSPPASHNCVPETLSTHQLIPIIIRLALLDVGTKTLGEPVQKPHGYLSGRCLMILGLEMDPPVPIRASRRGTGFAVAGPKVEMAVAL